MTTEKLSRREKLELEIRQKQARLKDLDAQERIKERKRETRRKFLIGGLILQEASNDTSLKLTIDRLINDHIISTNDRELFSLPPLKNESRIEEQGAQ